MFGLLIFKCLLTYDVGSFFPFIYKFPSGHSHKFLLPFVFLQPFMRLFSLCVTIWRYLFLVAFAIARAFALSRSSIQTIFLSLSYPLGTISFLTFLSFSCFSVDNLGGVSLTINEDGGGDSPISIVYGNPDIPDEEPLEVNNTIPNLIVLSDASRKCTTMRSKIIRSSPQGDEFEYIFLA